MKKQQITFFDEEKRYEKLTALGDPLEQLNKVIKWEMFRSKLTKACQQEDTGKGGRPPIDVIVKFKASTIKRIYNLSYEQTEYQINDRLSFMRFLGISLSDRVLDANTIWDFENTLAQAGLMEELFCMFDEMLEKNYINKDSIDIISCTLDYIKEKIFKKSPFFPCFFLLFYNQRSHYIHTLKCLQFDVLMY